MGLAASQARFLAITSRKADCENRSMSIAQEKLSITGELSKISDQYQAALDATKLVWDGETEDGTVYDLTYDIMMKPSELNAYSPYIVTNRIGQVVCNEQIAKACEAAGIDEVATNGSLNGRNLFVQALADVGYISAATADVITGAGGNATVEWSALAGFGGNLLDKSTAKSMAIGTMVNYMDNVLDPNFRKQFSAASTQRQNYEDLAQKLTLTGIDGVYIGGASNSGDFTVVDLLTKDVSLKMNTNLDDYKKALEAVLKGKPLTLSSSNAEVNKMLKSLSGVSEAFKAMLVDDTETKDTQAYEFALKQTIQQLLDNANNIGKKTSTTDLLTNSNDYNGAVFRSKNAIGVVSLSNMTEMFLTNYAIALDGYDSGYYIGEKSIDSSYVTNDYNYPYILKNQESLYEEKDLMTADFINVLYNNICTYGWTRSTGDVNDKEFLQNSLKNGKYFISSLNNDLFYYQDHYTKNGCVGEVTDEDAITKAEAEYTSQKSKLNYKEETLNIELQQLDLEISALTTEYDTVKSMISKNVEKVFTMFSS